MQMANPEHLKILKDGVEVWNRWREEHPEIEPDLTAPASTTPASSAPASTALALIRPTSKAPAEFRGRCNLESADLRFADLAAARIWTVDMNNA